MSRKITRNIVLLSMAVVATLGMEDVEKMFKQLLQIDSEVQTLIQVYGKVDVFSELEEDQEVEQIAKTLDILSRARAPMTKKYVAFKMECLNFLKEQTGILTDQREVMNRILKVTPLEDKVEEPQNNNTPMHSFPIAGEITVRDSSSSESEVEVSASQDDSQKSIPLETADPPTPTLPAPVDLPEESIMSLETADSPTPTLQVPAETNVNAAELNMKVKVDFPKIKNNLFTNTSKFYSVGEKVKVENVRTGKWHEAVITDKRTGKNIPGNRRYEVERNGNRRWLPMNRIKDEFEWNEC